MAEFLTNMVLKTKRQIYALEQKLKFYEDKLENYKKQQAETYKEKRNNERQ